MEVVVKATNSKNSRENCSESFRHHQSRRVTSSMIDGSSYTQFSCATVCYLIKLMFVQLWPRLCRCMQSAVPSHGKDYIRFMHIRQLYVLCVVSNLFHTQSLCAGAAHSSIQHETKTQFDTIEWIFIRITQERCARWNKKIQRVEQSTGGRQMTRNSLHYTFGASAWIRAMPFSVVFPHVGVCQFDIKNHSVICMFFSSLVRQSIGRGSHCRIRNWSMFDVNTLIFLPAICDLLRVVAVRMKSKQIFTGLNNRNVNEKRREWTQNSTLFLRRIIRYTFF